MLELLSFLLCSWVVERMAAVGRAPWCWGKVEILGHRSHVGRFREECHLGARVLAVEVPRHDGGWSRHVYPERAIFSLSETSEEQARRGVFGLWGAPCETFAASAVLADRCATCGHDADDHARHARSKTHLDRAAAVRGAVARTLHANIFNIDLKWDSDGPAALIVDVEAWDTRIDKRIWTRLSSEHFPLTTWDEAAKTWDPVDLDHLLEELASLVEMEPEGDGNLAKTSAAWRDEIANWTAGEQHEAMTWAEAASRFDPDRRPSGDPIARPACVLRLPMAKISYVEPALADLERRHVFVCSKCKQERPYGQGADDDQPDVCDACYSHKDVAAEVPHG